MPGAQDDLFVLTAYEQFAASYMAAAMCMPGFHPSENFRNNAGVLYAVAIERVAALRPGTTPAAAHDMIKERAEEIAADVSRRVREHGCEDRSLQILVDLYSKYERMRLMQEDTALPAEKERTRQP